MTYLFEGLGVQKRSASEAQTLPKQFQRLLDCLLLHEILSVWPRPYVSAEASSLGRPRDTAERRGKTWEKENERERRNGKKKHVGKSTAIFGGL